MLFFSVKAQKLINVATQRFEEKVPFQAGDVLKLNLEKVQVTIIGKDQSYYAFEIVFKSRHKDREQAVKELSYLTYQLKNQGDTIYFFNDFVSGDTFQKVQGVLNIELRIMAPKSSGIVVENAYGKTEVRDLSGAIDLKGKFVETKVSQCQGELSLNAVFGEHHINDHNGNITLKLSRADLVGHQIEGDIKGETNYGEVHFSGLRTKDLKVDAIRTAFTLELDDASLPHYSYDLFTKLGQILIAGTINEKAFNQWKYKGRSDSNIKITSTFSPIIIRDQSLNPRKK